MVKIAIAGATSELAREVIDGLVATGKHEIIAFSRRDTSGQDASTGLTWIKADYEDVKQLESALQGVHTVLSFIVSMDESSIQVQKNLIDASIAAGVKRFAPSEWATVDVTALPWYQAKKAIRDYLEEVNKEKKVLEYSLFQPGGFINYLAWPHKTTKHVSTWNFHLDFQNRRALVVEGQLDGIFTATTVADIVGVVARAVEYEGEWPVFGGIKGSDVTARQILALGEKLRGRPFDVEILKEEEVAAGQINASWFPRLEHATFKALPEETRVAMEKQVVGLVILSFGKGVWHVGDEWNRLLPDYKFTDAETFLTEVWKGQP